MTRSIIRFSSLSHVCVSVCVCMRLSFDRGDPIWTSAAFSRCTSARRRSSFARETFLPLRLQWMETRMRQSRSGAGGDFCRRNGFELNGLEPFAAQSRRRNPDKKGLLSLTQPFKRIHCVEVEERANRMYYVSVRERKRPPERTPAPTLIGHNCKLFPQPFPIPFSGKGGFPPPRS